MRFWIGLCSVAILLGAATPAVVAAGDNAEAVIALHVATRTSKNLCNITLPSRCEDYVTETVDSGFFNVYLTISNGDTTGIAGAQFGVTYENALGMGCDVNSWRSCADLEFTSDDWPGSGSGNLITWEYSGNCQGQVGGVSILAGAFELTTYSGDMFSITPRPVDGLAKVANCFLIETDLTTEVPSRLGVASFGNGAGYNPCLGPLTPVRETTWGSIKTLYENN